MQLEKIVLNGFKSFADKTEFPIKADITAIVGPNGCGKSNVVDAVKWVLGEQKVKSLRSDHMIDVIFSGSGSRKPLGSAEVLLVFANPQAGGARSLSLDADQVQIARKVYRNGDSEYRINGKTCRLKDIRELLMDTGVGTKAYSIIEQGQIDKILGATKTDRRAVFEEAAGISKYKAHKKEALRKLDRAEQNLLRLADILQEVAKRLRSVKLQAGKARNYLEYTQRLKELQVNYSLVEYSRNYEALEATRKKLDLSGEQFAQLAANVSKTDTVLSQLGSTIIEKEHALSEAGNALVSVQSSIEQKMQRIEFLRARIHELDERQQTQRQTIETMRAQTQGFEADLARYNDELSNCERILQDKSGATEELQEVVQQSDGDLAMVEADLADEKSGIIDIVRRTAQLHNEIQSMSNFRSNLTHQKDRLATRAESARAELETVLTEKAQHSARLGDIEKVLTELQENLDAKRGNIEALETGLTQDRQQLAAKKEQRSADTSELAVLTEMERRREGVDEAVRKLLQEQAEGLDYVEGIVADRIETHMDYAKAVEAGLGPWADAVIVNDMQALLAHRSLHEGLEGRVRFVDRNQVAAFGDVSDLTGWDGVRGRLMEFVNCDPCYAPLIWSLLGRTIVVESLDHALTVAGRLGADYRVVTLQGELLEAQDCVCLGPLGQVSGLISRKSRMRQLQDAVDQITAEITGLELEIGKNDQTRQHLSKLCKDLRTAIYEASTEKMQVSSKLTVYEQNVERLRQEEPLISGEIEALENQLAESVQKEYDSKQKLDELETVNNERNAHIQELEGRMALLREQRQMQVSELTELKIELGQIAEQGKAARQIIASMHTQVENSLRGVKLAEQEIAQCREQIELAQGDILSCEAQVSELFVDKEAAQVSNRQLKETIVALMAQQQEAEQSIRTQREEKEQVEQDLNDLRVRIGQLEVKIQDLTERVRDELQIDLVEAYEDYTAQDMNWDEVRDEINLLRGKIERLGNVNVDAIEEQMALEERHEFLSSQVEDLNTSKAELQQLINKLNKTSREKFAETFAEIRDNFQQIFRKLFGGGRADIILEEADDILDAGIEVVAKPPGKETRSITLLSGGEKSMTALALQFAVFRSKPSPFCFLDEVDAALDEANNERFNMLIKEFRQDTQFIVITHAKRTMSIADVLYGVTMQTQGVSKKISVRFDEYDQEEAAVA
jgi:chromosome segregation protein